MAGLPQHKKTTHCRVVRLVQIVGRLAFDQIALGLLNGGGFLHLAVEPVHTAFGIDQLLTTGEEGVAAGTNFHTDVALVRGTCHKLVPTSAGD